jgi:glutathione synthase/RimK-type ligase-like ATP-grasp enzyme
MTVWTIVCDRKDDVPALPANAVAVTTRDYLADRGPGNGAMAKKTTAGRRRPAKVLNLARDTSYQARGYYVSLLAEARGEKVLPSVETILALRRRSGYALAIPDLEEALNKTARRLADPPDASFSLRILLGRPNDSRFKRFALLVFDWFRAPLLEVVIQPGAWWRIKRLGTLSLGDLGAEERPALDAAIGAYLGRRWLEPKTRTEPRFTLAVLYDAKDPLPPTDLSTLKRFARIAEGMGLGVDLIGKGDMARLAAYDALWIRATTNIDHYTYRFAQRAEQEGMPVIDDPRSIMRCTNKVFMAELLTAHGLPTPPTRIIAGRRDVEAAAAVLGYPLVLKIPDGSFSRGVKKAEDRAALERLAAEMLEDSDLILAQAFMPTTFDWRVGVLGREPLFVSQYHMAKKHWQIVRHEPGGKTTSGRFNTMPIGQAPRAVIDVAVRAAGLMGSGLYGVDIKETPGGVVVIEVNDNPDLNHDVEDLAEKDQVWRRLVAWFLDRLR